MAVSFKLEGLDDTIRALGEMSRATQRNVIRRVLRKAGQPILDGMILRAPRATGMMIAKLDMSSTLTANERRDAGNVAQFLGMNDSGQRTFRSARNANVEIHIGAVGAKQNSPVPMWIEFGTENMGAQPFARPTWESGKGRSADVIVSGLKAEVDKTAARLARRAAKFTRS